MAQTTPAFAPEHQQWFGHPRGLATLFFTEMWERFSYYGMRGILILYMAAAAMDGGLEFDDPKAGAVYGLYVSGVYLLALPGGWVADKLWGQRRAVFVGGCFIAAGNFSLAVPTGPGGLVFFYAGLVLICIGTGLLKPNVSTMVGELYPEGGARRDAGFSVFYMGINLGAFIAPIIVGYLGENIDWHLGFLASGVAMTLGLVQYRMGGKYLGKAGFLNADADSLERRAVLRRNFYLAMSASAVLILGGSWWLLAVKGVALSAFAFWVGVGIVLIAVGFFVYLLTDRHLSAIEKRRVLVMLMLFIFAAVFWSGFEQAGSSMNLFAERLTDRVMFGWEMPASWLQSINPIFIILFAPVFGWLWIALGRSNPSIPVKFSLGLLLLASGFLVLAWGAANADNEQLVSPAWLVVTYFLHTCGELCLSPVGLSSFTKLAPKDRVGQMMGIWFIAAALGNLFAGLVAGQLETLSSSALFGTVTSVIGGIGVVALLLSPGIKRFTAGVE